MGASVQGEFPALAERLQAAVHSADERLLVRMRVLVFSKILREREHFVTILAGKCLLSAVDIVVALQREFSRESLATAGKLTLEDTLTFSIIRLLVGLEVLLQVMMMIILSRMGVNILHSW